jgi:hypothetical protein
MKYFKIYEEFSHQMILLDNEKLQKSIPTELTIIHNDNKVKYERGDIIPSDSKIEAFYIKTKEKEVIYKGDAPEKLILKVYAKSENNNIMRYMDNEKVIFLEITDGNSPCLSMKLTKSKIDHSQPQKIKIEKSTKNKIVKLIKTFGINLKTKDF